MGVISDPIADLLTRIRNAQLAKHADVEIPGSKLKFEIAKILARQGYVETVQWLDQGPQGAIRIQLKYDNDRQAMIRKLRRISKPSRRVYVGAQEIPRVLNGLGIAIVSTSKGLMTGQEARAANMGGEVLCEVY